MSQSISLRMFVPCFYVIVDTSQKIYHSFSDWDVYGELTLHKMKYMNEFGDCSCPENCSHLIHCVVMKCVGNEYMNLSECFSPICAHGL